MKERLDVLLVRLGLAESRERAQAEILSGNVLVNENVVTKCGTKIDDGFSIRLKEAFPYVSRGALKLLHALDYFKISVENKVAIDVGSSTGGFTQVLLERGAKSLYAVDSGTNQLAWKLRNHPKITVMENTNARYLEDSAFNQKPSIATMDVSFISVTKILPSLIRILEKPYQIIILIKPQFELSPDLIEEKGLVSEKNRRLAIDNVLTFAKSIGLVSSEVIESPITGAKSGNVEFLTVLTAIDRENY